MNNKIKAKSKHGGPKKISIDIAIKKRVHENIYLWKVINASRNNQVAEKNDEYEWDGYQI